MWGSENIWLVALCGLSSLVGSVLYMLGGTAGWGLLTRRLGGASALTLGANVAAVVLGVWSWQYLFLLPLLWGGFALPYGASTTIEKVIKRLIFALGVTASCFMGVWAHNFSGSSWIVFGLAVVTGLGSIVLGVINPLVDATAEQFLICGLLTMYVPFLPFCK